VIFDIIIRLTHPKPAGQPYESTHLHHAIGEVYPDLYYVCLINKGEP